MPKNFEEAMRYYSESAELGNIQAQIILTERNKESKSNLDENSNQMILNELETSLARDLASEDREEVGGHYKNKNSLLGHNLERLGVKTNSTLPTNQDFKENNSSNPYIRTDTNPRSLASEYL